MQQHTFDVQIAKVLGVYKAILLQYIEFWVHKNQANGICIANGKAWVYHTAEAFVEIFPYMSKAQVYRFLRELQQEGYIESSTNIEKGKNRNQSTKYYSLTDLYYESFKNENQSFKNENQSFKNENQSFKNENQSFKNENPINDISNLENNITRLELEKELEKELENISRQNSSAQLKLFEQDIAPNSPPKPMLDFEVIWAMYPRKVAKKEAKRVFKKKITTLAVFEKLKQSIREHISSVWRENLAKNNLEYIPHLRTFLYQERWEDTLPSTKPKGAQAILSKALQGVVC